MSFFIYRCLVYVYLDQAEDTLIMYLKMFSFLKFESGYIHEF